MAAVSHRTRRRTPDELAAELVKVQAELEVIASPFMTALKCRHILVKFQGNHFTGHLRLGTTIP